MRARGLERLCEMGGESAKSRERALEMAKLASLLLRDIPAFEDPFHSALPTVRATHKDFQYNVVSTAPFAVGTQN